MDPRTTQHARKGTKAETLCEWGYDDALLIDPDYLDEAIIGVSHDGRAVYSHKLLIEAYVKHDGMTPEDAEEWISYNVIRSIPYEGERAPIILFEID